MSDRTIIIIGIFGAGIALMALAGVLYLKKQTDGARRCATIGAEFIDGSRGLSVCAKPDGSLWRLP